MAQFRTTADIVDSILRRAGEVTNGNSAFESDALEYLNRVHHAILAGGSLFNMEVDESWTWAHSKAPIILELQPAYETGTVSVTNASEACTFSSAPTSSYAGWHIRVGDDPEVYKILTHAANSANFELDAPYVGTTAATASHKTFKLDYDLVPQTIHITSENNKIDFEETASSELTATLTVGVYTPAALATEVDTQLTAAGASAYTITYDTVTRKFTLASDRAGGGGTFKLLFASGSNAANSAAAPLGFDDEDQADAASQVGKYALGGISRLIEPFRVQRASREDSQVYGIDKLRFDATYPVHKVREALPAAFCRIEEDQDGRVTVRFDSYPKEARRLEINYVPVPRDLKDNAISRVLLPRKDLDVLEYGAAFYLCLDKEDSKADVYGNLAKQALEAMQKRNRNELRKIDSNFGQITPRPEYLEKNFRRLRYGYTSGD